MTDEFVGTKKGMLEVIGIGDAYIKPDGTYGCKRYTVKCKCGKIKDMTKGVILKKNTKSCGCFSAKKASENGKNRKTHGMTKTTTYKSWIAMKERCYRKSSPNYNAYGGRGITVCDRWKSSFDNFFEDMGERPNGKTLDRKNTDKGYCKENCRWATPKQQSYNRRNNKLKIDDKEKIVFLFKNGNKRKDIANTYGISYSYVCSIIKNW